MYNVWVIIFILDSFIRLLYCTTFIRLFSCLLEPAVCPSLSGSLSFLFLRLQFFFSVLIWYGHFFSTIHNQLILFPSLGNGSAFSERKWAIFYHSVPMWVGRCHVSLNFLVLEHVGLLNMFFVRGVTSALNPLSDHWPEPWWPSVPVQEQ